MASPQRVPRRPDEDPALHVRAMDNLSFIRQTMERATAFTAVPGWGGVGMGLLALAAAGVAETRLTPTEWLVTWLVTSALGLALGGWTMAAKARRAGARCSRTRAAGSCSASSRPLAGGRLLTGCWCARGSDRPSGDLAAAVRHRRRHRRCVLRAGGAGHGALLHGAGRRGALRSGGLGQLAHGRRLRRPAHRVRHSSSRGGTVAKSNAAPKGRRPTAQRRRPRRRRSAASAGARGGAARAGSPDPRAHAPRRS